MKSIKIISICLIIGTLLYAPTDKVIKKDHKIDYEGRAWVEGLRGWSEDGVNLWTSVSPLPLYNVGIGTLSPLYKLDVQGTGHFTGALTIGSYTLPSTDSTGGYVLKTNGAGSVTWQPDANSGGNITGSGIQNYLARWTGATNLSTGIIYDDSTNVGIGTTTPGHKLQVASTGTNKDVLLIQETTGGAGNTANLAFKTNSGTGITDAIMARIKTIDRGNFNADMAFGVKTNSANDQTTTEVMRITKDGCVSIGDTTSHTRLYIESSWESTYPQNGGGIYVANTGTTPNSHSILCLRTGVNSVPSYPGGDAFLSFDFIHIVGFSLGMSRSDSCFHIARGWNFVGNYGDFTLDKNGNIGIGTTRPTNILEVQQNSPTDPIADAWTTYSSRRWKTNIEPISNALSKVMELQGVYYDWKANGKHDIGMIAEDVGKVIPEVVAYEKNGTDAKSLDYARLVAVLVEAIKEQQKEIEGLKKEINDIKSNRDKLSATMK
uniref:Tail fiber domain-containing protein n=1 Tax=candidate division WOR-3 bacterium TaxID=2052148 RepID=A0A7V3RII3_UNCW3